MAMTRKAALAALEDLRASAHAQFTYAGSADRLAQLDGHVATVQMLVEHLFDEDARHPKEG